MADFRDYIGMDSSAFLSHYGRGHLDGGNSGRYKWGSGKNPHQRSGTSTSAKKKKQSDAKLRQWKEKELANVDKRYNARINKLQEELDEKNKRYNSKENIDAVYKNPDTVYDQDNEMYKLESKISSLKTDRETERMSIANMTLDDVNTERLKIIKEKILGGKLFSDAKAKVRMDTVRDKLKELDEEEQRKQSEIAADNSRFHKRLSEIADAYTVTDWDEIEYKNPDLHWLYSTMFWDISPLRGMSYADAYREIVNASNDDELKAIASQYNGTLPSAAVIEEYASKRAKVVADTISDHTASSAFSNNPKIQIGKVISTISELDSPSMKYVKDKADSIPSGPKDRVVELFNEGYTINEIKKKQPMNSLVIDYILFESGVLDKYK